LTNFSDFWFSPISVIFLWILYGVTHSFLASIWIKKRVPLSSQSYRRVFIIIAILWASTLLAFSYYEVPTSFIALVAEIDILKIVLAASFFIAGNLMFIFVSCDIGV